ncbi:XrtA/PEP-CTERM system histidine kinase PrsK [Aurantiacibacter gangjinensis]|uniref:histidine kinase n=1 Tax=Aurantiacibacter gangjinensis TaxID=502682 RepID=A0A0G9MWF2_9SPHN|nr:XrtA/PEP-CTERM system histidine kinase PrsK [Aurantiacibacter gangjinensis]APE28599.1 Sensory transduction histidine kinase [Aurantiacibacter gangjinensis]KLE33603.1 histidine kinase [Aurantiacibacter gangjinensis]
MTSFWDITTYLAFLATACAAVALALWLITSHRAQGPAIKACAGALFFAALAAFCVIGMGYGSFLSDVSMIASNLAWLWLLYRLFAHDDRDKSLGPIRPVVAALGFVELMQVALIVARIQYGGMPDADLLITRFAITFRLLFCIGALVLVHNLYAGASAQSRQSLRWPAAALGVLWLYDLNLYTIAYLVDGLPGLLANLRVAALAIAVGLLALGTLRNESELRFRPSRNFAFQSFSLLLIGAYLVVMVVIAQGLAYVGTDYGRLLQTGFVLLASVVALTVLPSAKLRGWLRVTLSKNLFQHRYDYRAEWLRFTSTIGRAGPQAPPLPERAVQAVADITDSPAGLLLTPREEGGLALAARWQWPGIAVPAEAVDALGVTFLEDSQFIVDLDVLRSGQNDDVPDVATPAWLLESEESWAIVPLVHYDRLMGVVVLARPLVARRLDWEDFDVLRVVGRQLASYLAESASQDALGDAQRFDEFNRRMAFVMHDIKNLASQLSLLARNAEKHADKAEFRADMILTLRNSTDKLQGLLARLGRYGAQGGKERERVKLHHLVDRVVEQYRGKHKVVALQRESCEVQADAEGLEQALVHLVQNAIEASAPDQAVFLDMRIEPGHAVLEISDSGEGMSPEFIRTCLFKPFHSSKAGGFGIGAFEARELIRAMGGRLDVESREGLGTRFIIRLPFDQTAELIRSMHEKEKANEVA